MNDDTLPRPNMTPMIDVVFQLLVFFLVSMKFKTLDMKIEAQLPKQVGLSDTFVDPPPVTRVSARLVRSGRATDLRLDGQRLGTADDPATWGRLAASARGIRARHLGAGLAPDDLVAEVDGSRDVATGDVVHAIDTLLAADIGNVQFRGARR